jgi:hypothetical protein
MKDEALSRTHAVKPQEEEKTTSGRCNIAMILA